MAEGDFDWWKRNFGERLFHISENLTAHDEHLASLGTMAAAHKEYLGLHDEMNTTQNQRIDRLVERLDRAYTRIHALEKQLREK